MIAGRTDTSNGKTRKTKPHMKMEPMPYLCEQVNFDTHIRYSQLDAFAHLKNFNTIISNQTREQIDANKITIGFYGTSCEATTDANPQTLTVKMYVKVGSAHFVSTTLTPCSKQEKPPMKFASVKVVTLSTLI